MKQLLITFLAFFACLVPSTASAATWYVRADGGTRYTPTRVDPSNWGKWYSGQCDGLADAPYPGTGVNQHCAFNDFRYLYDDQTTYGSLHWVIQGGDTVILDNTAQWRVGWSNGFSEGDWCKGLDAFSCQNPTIPAGTPGNHTRIVGRNVGSCSVNGQVDPTKTTQLFGGFGVYAPLNLNGAQFVDVECLEITSHAQCMVHGYPEFPRDCNRSTPIDDFDGDGIQTSVSTHDILLQDLWIHGHTDRGIKGPISGVVTANRIDISVNGLAGWDFDNGNSTASVDATLNLTNSIIEFSGCNSVWPDPRPVSCYGQSSGGYGDGIGTPPNMGMNVNIDHDIFRYNTQDGEDFGHIDTGHSSLSITNSASYGNGGGQFKWGPAFSNVVFTNNLVVGNCLRMSKPLPGIPDTYNANLADFCRAGDALSFNFDQGATALFANNTIVSYSPTTFDMACNDSVSCSGVVFTFTNNIVRGFDNPATYNMGGQAGGPGGFCGASCNGHPLQIGTFNRSNNIFYGFRGGCVANTNQAQTLTGIAVNESCADAGFTNEPTGEASSFNEAELDNFNFTLTSSSPAIHAGIPMANVLADYNGLTRPTPPTLGAIEFVSATAAPAPVPAPVAPPVTPPAAPPVAPPAPPAPPVAPPAEPAPSANTPPSTQLIATSINVSISTSKTAHSLIKLTATIVPGSGNAVPTGTISLLINRVKVGPVTLKAGAVTFTVPAIVATLPVTVNYSGDKTYQASTTTTNPK